MRRIMMILAAVALGCATFAADEAPVRDAAFVREINPPELEAQWKSVSARKGLVQLSVVQEMRGIDPENFPSAEGIEVDASGVANFWVRREITMYCDYPNYYYHDEWHDRRGNLLVINKEAHNGILGTEWLEPASKAVGAAYKTSTGELAEEKMELAWQSSFTTLLLPEYFTEERWPTGQVRPSPAHDFDFSPTRKIQLDAACRVAEMRTYDGETLYELYRYEYTDDRTLVPSRIVWYINDTALPYLDVTVRRFTPLEDVPAEERKMYGNFIVEPDHSRNFNHVRLTSQPQSTERKNSESTEDFI